MPPLLIEWLDLSVESALHTGDVTGDMFKPAGPPQGDRAVPWRRHCPCQAVPELLPRWPRSIHRLQVTLHRQILSNLPVQGRLFDACYGIYEVPDRYLMARATLDRHEACRYPCYGAWMISSTVFRKCWALETALVNTGLLYTVPLQSMESTCATPGEARE